jgi:hypothetical protein
MDANRVLEAIATLEAEGEAITVRAVLSRTGGSMRDVASYVSQWRDGTLLPQTAWDHLEERVDDLRARIAADRALRLQHTHLKAMVGLLLKTVRTLADHPPPTEIHHTHPVRPMTRAEHSAQKKEEWAARGEIMRLLRGRYGR